MHENIRKSLKKIRLKINKIGSSSRNSKLKSKDFSIISNNCFARIVYQHFGLKYNTPTIGLYFYPNEYIRLLKNFYDYINEELTFINTKDSKYYDDLKVNGYENTIIGLLKDVEIVFLHYKTKEEAKEKWEKRIKRLSKNLIFKFNDQNGCTYENLKDFNNLPYKNKIMFTTKNYTEFESNVFIKKYRKKENVYEDYYSCYRYIDIIDYINKNVFKKNILHIIPTYNYSGAEKVAINIIKELKEYYDFDYCSFDGNTKEYLQESNINFICINNFNPFLIRKIVKKGNYDIIHAHDYKASCLCAFSCSKIPIISHIHNNNLWIRKLNANSILYLLSTFFIRKILTVSKSIEEEYIFSKCIKNKIVCIGNPVSRENILSKVSDDNFKKKYDICCLGRITDAKDPLRFARIIFKLKKTNPNIKAIWIGDGDLKEKFVLEIKKLNLEKNIDLIGTKKNPYIYVAQSKIFLLCSKWEGYGLAAFESLTLGVPTVTSNVGGLPGIVDNDCGKLCNSDDEFVSEINDLLSDDKKYEIKSILATKKSEILDNYEKYMKGIKKIYEQI